MIPLAMGGISRIGRNPDLPSLNKAKPTGFRVSADAAPGVLCAWYCGGTHTLPVKRYTSTIGKNVHSTMQGYTQVQAGVHSGKSRNPVP